MYKIDTKLVFQASMKHRAITSVALFTLWYVLENHYHLEVAAKGVEIAIFPYADAFIKEITGFID